MTARVRDACTAARNRRPTVSQTSTRHAGSSQAATVNANSAASVVQSSTPQAMSVSSRRWAVVSPGSAGLRSSAQCSRPRHANTCAERSHQPSGRSAYRSGGPAGAPAATAAARPAARRAAARGRRRRPDAATPDPPDPRAAPGSPPRPARPSGRRSSRRTATAPAPASAAAPGPAAAGRRLDGRRAGSSRRSTASALGTSRADSDMPPSIVPRWSGGTRCSVLTHASLGPATRPSQVRRSHACARSECSWLTVGCSRMKSTSATRCRTSRVALEPQPLRGVHRAVVVRLAAHALLEQRDRLVDADRSRRASWPCRRTGPSPAGRPATPPRITFSAASRRPSARRAYAYQTAVSLSGCSRWPRAPHRTASAVSPNRRPSPAAAPCSSAWSGCARSDRRARSRYTSLRLRDRCRRRVAEPGHDPDEQPGQLVRVQAGGVDGPHPARVGPRLLRVEPGRLRQHPQRPERVGGAGHVRPRHDRADERRLAQREQVRHLRRRPARSAPRAARAPPAAPAPRRSRRPGGRRRARGRPRPAPPAPGTAHRAPAPPGLRHRRPPAESRARREG